MTDRKNRYEFLFENAGNFINSRLRAIDVDSGPCVSELFIRWLKECALEDIAHPVALPPAGEKEIRAAENRLGAKLPSQLIEIYRVSDGVQWIIPLGGELLPMQGQFPPLAEISLAGKMNPPLSDLAFRYWYKNGRVYDESASVAVVEPDAELADEPELILEFSELDLFLALQAPSEGTCLIMALTDTYGFPVGTVLELESNIATRFKSIAHWLAAELALEDF